MAHVAMRTEATCSLCAKTCEGRFHFPVAHVRGCLVSPGSMVIEPGAIVREPLRGNG
jgi:hypothetical protein